MAAATVLRLQGVVAREVAATESAVLTVGALRAGTTANVIPEDAELLVNARTYDDDARAHVLAAITRIVPAEAAASGAPREPEIEFLLTDPAVVNDPAVVTRTGLALAGVATVVDPGLVTGSEDVGLLATAASAPCVLAARRRRSDRVRRSDPLR